MVIDISINKLVIWEVVGFQVLIEFYSRGKSLLCNQPESEVKKQSA